MIYFVFHFPLGNFEQPNNDLINISAICTQMHCIKDSISYNSTLLSSVNVKKKTRCTLMQCLISITYINTIQTVFTVFSSMPSHKFSRSGISQCCNWECTSLFMSAFESIINALVTVSDSLEGKPLLHNFGVDNLSVHILGFPFQNVLCLTATFAVVQKQERGLRKAYCKCI